MTDVATETDPTETPRRRGRPKGSRNKPRATDEETTTETGKPRWSHDFFPIHDATPEQLRKWDSKDGTYGPPSVITIERITSFKPGHRPPHVTIAACTRPGAKKSRARGPAFSSVPSASREITGSGSSSSMRYSTRSSSLT